MIIGIHGCSRSGKTTLSKLLKEKISKCKIIHQDHFVKKQEDLLKIYNPIDKKEEIDWDTPHSIDFDKFYEEVKNELEKYQVIIIEGFLLMEDERITNLLNLLIQINISKDNFVKRRRDPTSEWGIESEFYTEFVWECHLKCKKGINPIIIDGDKTVQVIEQEGKIFIQNDSKLIEIKLS